MANKNGKEMANKNGKDLDEKDNPNPIKSNKGMKESISNDTLHGLTKQPLPMTTPVKIHDYYNIVCIIFIILADINFLMKRTPSDILNHTIGKPIYDEDLDFNEDTHLPFTLLYNLFTTYLLIDTVWIIVQPGENNILNLKGSLVSLS